MQTIEVDLDRFIENKPQSDDVTMLLLRRE
jgi:hypothetical protein